MADTILDICNDALILAGQKTITALSDDNERARTVNQLYTGLIDYLLESHDWSFAKRQATLTASSTTPNQEYSYMYPLPNDFLRLAHDNDIAVDTDERWEKIGEYIYTDDDSLKITYIHTPTYEYDSSVTYAVGEYCLSSGTIYVCIQAGSDKTPASETEYWTAVTDFFKHWSGGARQALAFLIASRSAIALTGDDARARHLSEMYEYELQSAIHFDAQSQLDQPYLYHTYIEERS